MELQAKALKCKDNNGVTNFQHFGGEMLPKLNVISLQRKVKSQKKDFSGEVVTHTKQGDFNITQ